MPAKAEYLEQLDLFPGVEQIEFQHANTKGYVAILRQFKDGNKHQVTIPAQALPGRIYDLCCRPLADCWVSQNGFFKQGTRRVLDIGQLVALYVDLDCYKVGIEANEAVGIVYRDYIEPGKIPRPSMVIYSGQGAQLVWRIKQETAYALPVWQGVENWLIDQLKPLGADPQARDAARVLRVAGTFNLKNNTLVEIKYDSTQLYSLTDLCKQYIVPFLPQTENPKKNTPGPKIHRLFTEHSLFYSRMVDIHKLITLRQTAKPGNSKTWGRETMLFLYRYYNCMFSGDPERALEETLYLNQLFLQPLSLKEVESATRSAEIAFENRDNEEYQKQARKQGHRRYGYNYKTSTLIELLAITPEEQKHMLNLIGTVEKNSRRTERRHAEGRKDRRGGQAPCLDRQTYLFECQLNNQDKVLRAHELKAQGMSQRAIAQELKISVSTVNTYLQRVFGGGAL